MNLTLLTELRDYAQTLYTYWQNQGKKRNARQCRQLAAAIDELVEIRQREAIAAMEHKHARAA